MSDKELRELDAWIAEHVMDVKRFVGVKKRGYWYRPNAHGYTDRQAEAWWLTRDEAKKHEYLRGDEPVTICEFSTPLYTTDPAAAMQVLEKCVAELELKRAFPAIEKYSDLDGFQGWKVTALFSNGNQQTFSEVAETLPLAICLFAKQLFSK